MSLIGQPRDRIEISEEAKDLIRNGDLIERYTEFATKQVPGMREFHEALAILAVGHAVRNMKPLRTASPRLFVLCITREPRVGKTLSFKLARDSILSCFPVEEVALATPEGFADLLNSYQRPPVIAIDEFGASLAAGYTRMDHFLLRAYDGTAWTMVFRKDGIKTVPKEKMRISVVAMTTTESLSKATRVLEYALSGLFARFLIVRGDRGRIPDRIEPNPTFGQAVRWIEQNADGLHEFEFENSDARNEVVNAIDYILHGLPEELQMVYRGIDEQTAKVAMAHAATRLDNTITVEDADYAVSFVEQTVKRSGELMADVVETEYSYESKIARLADRIYNYVLSQGGRVNRSQVLRNLHLKAALADKAEKLLIEEERLAVIKAARPAFYCIPSSDKCEKCEYRKACPLFIVHL